MDKKTISKTLFVKKCPVCSSSKRIHKFDVIRKGITSKIYSCSKCKLVYNGIKLKFRRNTTILPFFSNKKKQEEAHKHWYPYAIQYMRVLKSKSNGRNFLDVGCGHGIFMEAAIKEGFSSWGVEPYKPSAKIALEKNLKVIEKPLASAKLPKQKFDLILALEVIEHFDDPLIEFKKMETILKDDGLIVMQTANENSLATLIKGKNRSYYYYDHLVYFSPKTLNYALNKVNLEIVNTYAGIIPFFKQFNSCAGFKKKFKVFKTHFLRMFVLNKPLLSSMTVFVKKRN